MSTDLLVILLLAMGVAWFWVSRRQVVSQAGSSGVRGMHSLPHYYGAFTSLVALLPAFVLLVVWIGFENSIFRWLAASYFPADRGADFNEEIALTQIQNVFFGIRAGEIPAWVESAAAAWTRWDEMSQLLKGAFVLALAGSCGFLAYRKVNPEFRARNWVEQIVTVILGLCSLVAIFTTVGIVLSVIFESVRFFTMISPMEFLFGLKWNPQIEFGENAGVGVSNYGAVPLFAGTLLISVIALLVAVPTGLFSAIYLSEYASMRVRSVVKPLMEILAGIPTVVYGFFAALTVAPFVSQMGESIGLNVSSESALAAGVVMGIMIIPFVASLSDDVINAVPQSLRDAAYGLGSTKSESIRQVILPAALPGIVGAVLLAVSRAVGETMIVVMAAGLAANLTANPLDAVTTVTSQIVTILVGDQEFDSAKTLSAFALALTLICVTLILNVGALQIVKKYREQYD